jgi:hypothetical protein
MSNRLCLASDLAALSDLFPYSHTLDEALTRVLGYAYGECLGLPDTMIGLSESDSLGAIRRLADMADLVPSCRLPILSLMGKIMAELGLRPADTVPATPPPLPTYAMIETALSGRRIEAIRQYRDVLKTYGVDSGLRQAKETMDYCMGIAEKARKSVAV